MSRLLQVLVSIFCIFAGTLFVASGDDSPSATPSLSAPNIEEDASSTPPSEPKKPGRVVVVGSKSYVPFDFLDSEDRPAGLFVDIWRLWSQKTGVAVDYRCMEWQEALEMVADGKADIVSGFFPNEDRKKVYDFGIPFFQVFTGIFYHKSIKGIEGAKDLSWYRVGVVTGDAAEDFLKPRLPDGVLVPHKTFKDLVEAAVQNEIHVFVCDTPVAIFYLKKFDKFSDFIHASKPLLSEKFHAGVRKGNSNLLSLVNQGFKAISAEEITRIQDKWTGSLLPTRLPWAWLIASAGALFLCIGAVLLWNSRLKTKVADATEALSQSEEQWRRLFENADEGILVTQGGSNRFFNPKMLEITGADSRDLESGSFFEFVHAEDREGTRSYHQKLLEGDDVPDIIEFRVQNKKGDIKWILGTGVRIDWEGQPAELAFLTNITERKQMEIENAQLQTQLLQAQKMEAIGTLAGGVAHDFNNMLTSMLGYADMAMLRLDKADPLFRYVEQIRATALRASGVTRKLLLFSRKEAMESRYIQLNNTIENLIKMLERLIGENIVIKTEPGPDLWTVQADEGSIEQVAMNLVMNSRDAMPDGGTVTIRTDNVYLDSNHSRLVSGSRPGNFVRMTIDDTGFGMDEEMLKHVFEPFFTTKKGEEGTGLGLAVVYGIVKQHGGWINVDSEHGRGTTFEVYLPAVMIRPEENSEKGISLEELQGRGERILLVEDEAEVREFAANVLSNNGFVVFEAGDAKEGLDIFDREQGNFNLIFSDVVLPGESGLNLVAEIFSRRPQIHVLLTSGYSDEKSQWEKIQEKGFPFLNKPYGISDLLKAIKVALADRGKD